MTTPTVVSAAPTTAPGCQVAEDAGSPSSGGTALLAVMSSTPPLVVKRFELLHGDDPLLAVV